MSDARTPASPGERTVAQVSVRSLAVSTEMSKPANRLRSSRASTGASSQTVSRPSSRLAGESAQRGGRFRNNGRALPDWLPPFLVAALTILFLNVALLEQRRRARRRDWDYRLLRELRSWDGRLPDDLARPH